MGNGIIDCPALAYKSDLQQAAQVQDAKASGMPQHTETPVRRNPQSLDTVASAATVQAYYWPEHTLFEE
jgi:hypothetical protein